MSNDKLLTRIGALLRKAEKTDNQHEAEAYLQAAQRLATQSAIDLAVARAHVAARAASASPIQRQIPLGERGKRGLKTYARLFLAIAAANDLTVDIAHNSTYVIAFGFADDIDVTQALYSSLVVQMVAASDAYLRTGEHRNEIVWNERKSRYVPLSGSAARINFQTAFAARIGKRLKDSTTETREVAERMPGTALALRNKEIEVADFYKQRTSARGTWKPRRSEAYSEYARAAGDHAGRNARIGATPALPTPRKQLV